MKEIKSKIFFFILLFVALFLEKVEAGRNENISGWAWSENIGWVSFNSINDGSSINYGVKIDSYGNFSGYAWSENIGWISFNRSDTGPPPSPDPCSEGSCIAKLEDNWKTKLGKEKVKVIGWARVLSTDGGWDGWIRFDHGKSGEVEIYPNGEFHGWAWSNGENRGPFGWLSFNSSDPGAGGAEYKVVLDFSSFRPDPPSGLRENWDHCTYKQLSIPTFSWDYSHPANQSQGGYQIVVSYGENILLDETVPSSAQSYTPKIEWVKNNLSFNETYSWKVKVRDVNGNWSDWSEPKNFSMPPHSYPWVNFNWFPQKPTVNEVVQFCSTEASPTCTQIPDGGWSECYTTGNTTTTCSSWYWNFDLGNASPASSTFQNPTTTFTTVSPDLTVSPGLTVKLTITDRDNFSCTKTKSIKVLYPLPKYKEAPPVTFLRTALRKILGFLRI